MFRSMNIPLFFNLCCYACCSVYRYFFCLYLLIIVFEMISKAIFKYYFILFHLAWEIWHSIYWCSPNIFNNNSMLCLWNIVIMCLLASIMCVCVKKKSFKYTRWKGRAQLHHPNVQLSIVTNDWLIVTIPHSMCFRPSCLFCDFSFLRALAKVQRYKAFSDQYNHFGKRKCIKEENTCNYSCATWYISSFLETFQCGPFIRLNTIVLCSLVNDQWTLTTGSLNCWMFIHQHVRWYRIDFIFEGELNEMNRNAFKVRHKPCYGRSISLSRETQGNLQKKMKIIRRLYISILNMQTD